MNPISQVKFTQLPNQMSRMKIDDSLLAHYIDIAFEHV